MSHCPISHNGIREVLKYLAHLWGAATGVGSHGLSRGETFETIGYRNAEKPSWRSFRPFLSAFEKSQG